MKVHLMKSKYFVIFYLFIHSAFASDQLSIDEQTALFTVTDQTVPIVTAKYVGWGANWQWAGASVTSDFVTDTGNDFISANFSGSFKNLGVDFNGSASPAPNQVIWSYDWNFAEDHPDAIGYGLEFNLNLTSPSFLSAAEAPVLLPDNKGWRWQTPDGQTVQVEFTPALSDLYFERGQKNKIRAYFHNAIGAGSEQTTMTVSVSDNVAISGPAMLQYDGTDPAQWNENALPALTSPVDLSFLNSDHKPAGKHGFILADTDKLIFEDGTPAKFWGANVQAYALFHTADENIKLHAKRIAQLGFNLIRIHHHDSQWVKPNIFNNPDDNTQTLREDSLYKLDQWIRSLKEEGVYVWLDLHVGRAFTQNDNIENFDDFAKGKNASEAKGFNYYNDSIQAQMQAFNEAYLNHLNPFTRLTYKNDPAIIGLLITNENDLTHHFGNKLLPDKNVPIHNAIFSEDVHQFADTYGLPFEKTWTTWKMGESKLYLNDAEHRFNQIMMSHLELLGVKSLIATTSSWGRMGIFGLPALTDGSIIDAHSYGRAEEFNYNPRYNPGFLTWIGAAQVSGKPLSVSEWNIEPFPARDRFTAPIFTASIAAFQGWDAMMLYGYSQSPLNGWANGSNYSSFNDPAIMGLMPAAALLYRQSHVAEAEQHFELQLSRNDFFFINQNPQTAKTVRTLLETSRLSITMPDVLELPWLRDNVSPTGQTTIITNANQDFIPAGQNFVVSDTGELKRDWEAGIHTVNTTKSQVASGWIGGNPIQLDDVSFYIDTKKAVVAVQSLEDKPIRQSKKIFITAMARSQPLNGNTLPFMSEPVSGKLLIKAPRGLQLFPITRTGEEGEPIPVRYTWFRGNYEITLSNNEETHWFVLRESSQKTTKRRYKFF